MSFLPVTKLYHDRCCCHGEPSQWLSLTWHIWVWSCYCILMWRRWPNLVYLRSAFQGGAHNQHLEQWNLSRKVVVKRDLRQLLRNTILCFFLPVNYWLITRLKPKTFNRCKINSLKVQNSCPWLDWRGKTSYQRGHSA